MQLTFTNKSTQLLPLDSSAAHRRLPLLQDQAPANPFTHAPLLPLKLNNTSAWCSSSSQARPTCPEALGDQELRLLPLIHRRQPPVPSNPSSDTMWFLEYTPFHWFVAAHSSRGTCSTRTRAAPSRTWAWASWATIQHFLFWWQSSLLMLRICEFP